MLRACGGALFYFCVASFLAPFAQAKLIVRSPFRRMRKITEFVFDFDVENCFFGPFGHRLTLV